MVSFLLTSEYIRSSSGYGSLEDVGQRGRPQLFLGKEYEYNACVWE
jgi:hypothetical protein